MDFILQNWWLILIIVVCLVLLVMPNVTGQNSGLTPEQATQLVNRKNAWWIDLREEKDFAAQHIARAKNIPAKQLETRLPQVVKNKGLPLIFVCYSGIMAFAATKKARQLGYTNVNLLGGGMKAWNAANLPTKTAGSPSTSSKGA